MRCRAKITPKPPHIHSFVEEQIFIHAVASGDCSSELILDAFDKFGPRPFLGIKETMDSKEFSWASYTDIKSHVLAFSRALRWSGIVAGDSLLLVADLSRPYVVAMLGMWPPNHKTHILKGSVLAGCILIPAHGDQPVSSLTHVMKETNPRAAFVDKKFKAKVSSHAISF